MLILCIVDYALTASYAADSIKAIVAVDFGTRGAGFAYLRTHHIVDEKTELKQLGESVSVHMAWDGEPDPKNRTSTSILFKGDDPLISGTSEEIKWEDLMNMNDVPYGYYLFKSFKNAAE